MPKQCEDCKYYMTIPEYKKDDHILGNCCFSEKFCFFEFSGTYNTPIDDRILCIAKESTKSECYPKLKRVFTNAKK